MRVVVLADFAVPSGGAQTVALESARALAELGVGVTYVHSIGHAGDVLLDHPRIRRIGLGFQDIWDRPAAAAAAAGLWNAAAARALRPVLSGLPAEPIILHLHQWTRAFSPSILPILLASGHPVVVTLHDYFLACPNGVYYRFDRDEPCDARPLSLRCVAARCDPKSSLHKAVRTVRVALTSHLLRGAGIDVIHVSQRGRATIAPLLPSQVRHHRVDNPVRVAKARPAEIRGDAKIAYVGRLTREKGADLVAAAAREAGLPVLFIGEGPLETEIRGRNPDAEILGWRSPDEVDALLRRRVLALAAPSRWYETGPLTVYEAMAAGVPAIASNRSGAAERVVHGETGLVVEPNAEALAQALRRLAHPAEARRMGQAAFEHYWAAPSTPEAHGRSLLTIYEAMLAGA